MDIPKTFELLGSTWKVKKTKNLRHSDGDDCDGLCRADKRLIELDEGTFSDKDRLLHTFIHEMTHSVLEAAGLHDISEDEDKVELISGLVHQSIKTSKGVLT